MNYKTYQNLTQELKEEYNWRFKEPIYFNVFYLSLTIMSIFIMIILLIFMIYLISTVPTLKHLTNETDNFILVTQQLFKVLDILIIGFIIEYLVRVITRFIVYHKWIKNNNIKFIYWWTRE